MHNNYIPLTGRAFEGSENFSAIRASTSGSRKLRLRSWAAMVSDVLSRKVKAGGYTMVSSVEYCPKTKVVHTI